MKKEILAFQLPCTLGQRDINFARVEKTLGSRTPDFLILPEVWSVGWYPEIFKECAGSETLEFLQNLAKSRGINIIGGSYIRKSDGKLYNSCPVIDRSGALLGHYDKNHLFYCCNGDNEPKFVEPGKKLMTFELEGVRIGLSICYDIRFPELFRTYMKLENPPHLLVNLAAWPESRKAHYRALCKARAIENQAWFLGLSQCGEIKNGVFNSGCSSLTDPFGDTVMALNEAEGEILATIDTEYADEIRKKYPNLKAIKEGYLL